MLIVSYYTELIYYFVKLQDDYWNQYKARKNSKFYFLDTINF